MLTGLAQGVIAIVTATFSCRVTCISSSHHTNVVYARNVREFTDVPITNLPTMPSQSPIVVEAETATGRMSSPPAYQEKQGNQDQDNVVDPLSDQDPWQRFD